MPVKPNISEEQLITALQNKDSKAVSKLYDQYAPALFGVIFRIVKSKTLAEDVLQEVIVKIWQNIDSYDAAKGRFLSWMLRIAHNKAIDLVRSNTFKQTQYYTDNEDNRSEVGKETTNVDTIGIKELLHKLAPEYQDTFRLAYFEGYTQVEIAEELNIPLGTVKSRIRIGLRELRKFATL